jgi:hypothetical protein
MEFTRIMFGKSIRYDGRLFMSLMEVGAVNISNIDDVKISTVLMKSDNITEIDIALLLTCEIKWNNVPDDLMNHIFEGVVTNNHFF